VLAEEALALAEEAALALAEEAALAWAALPVRENRASGNRQSVP